MAERDRIARYFAPLTQGESGAFYLNDDAALLSPPAGKQLVLTTDSVIQNIHVLPEAMPQQFAQKLVRRNLSDLAAMGAKPWRYTLNLHTPTALSEDWFAQFSAALAAEQQQFGMVLVGGDSTSGGNVIHTTMTCLGLLEGPPLRRAGAQIGDDIYVSGTIGDAAFALSMLQQNAPVTDMLAARYHCPTPRLELGQMLHGVANAAMDISDGLIADMVQLCAASHCGAEVLLSAVPLSKEMQRAVQQNPKTWGFALSGGDDYELLFTAPSHQRDTLRSLAMRLGLPLTHIGTIMQAQGIRLRDENGAAIPLIENGWEYR